MKLKKKMDSWNKYSVPKCYVVVRKLTFSEISRISISPHFVNTKCGRCSEPCDGALRCEHCSVAYHFECSQMSQLCCGYPILTLNVSTQQHCPKCHHVVHYGPVCQMCGSMFHATCIGPFDECCKLNLYDPPKRDCSKCSKTVYFGPVCPLCKLVYHVDCLENKFICCNIDFMKDDTQKYKCGRCRKFVSKGCPMCTKCCKIFHNYCIPRVKQCCGRPVQLEIFFTPSFKYFVHNFNNIIKRKAALFRLEEIAETHNHELRSLLHRAKPKSSSCQTSAVDNIEIISIKSEVEEDELDIPKSPPLLHREDVESPEPPCSSTHKEDVVDEAALKNFFDFLYNAVKKLPPQVQAQVKIDFFKTVVEAEMNS